MKFTEDYINQAGKLLTNVFQVERPKLLAAHGDTEHSLKDDATVVTEMDKAMEASIRQALLSFDASVGLEGEELGKEGNDMTYWLIDPIDGTESFIRGLPAPRNVATLIDDGQPVFTIIYKFVTDELFTATKSKGAFRNGQPIKVSNRPLDRAWIDYGTKLADPARLHKYLAIRQHVAGYTIMRDFLLIASGQLDGIIWDLGEGGPWDYAPRGLLYAEAGAKVANVGSDTFDFRNKSLIAAGPQIFDELSKLYNEN